MNEPERFQSGELLSASRLNDALEYSRGQYASVPGTDYDVFGGSNANGRAQKRFERIMLVRARENFEVRVSASGSDSDCSNSADVPSGRVDLPRIIPQLNQYEVPTSIRPDYVYDPVAGLSGGASKREGDYFHAVYNEDSGRWEVLSAPSAPVLPAIVNVCLGDGWYEVEITDWDGDPSQSTSSSLSVSASVSDEDGCNLCPLIDTVTDSSCTAMQSIAVDRNTGTPTGEIVYAHTTRLLPMMIGGMIKIMKRTSSAAASQSASASASTSASASVSDDIFTDRLYDVVDGVFPLLALPFPDYACCTDPVTGAQTVELIGCTRAIVEGYECAMAATPCPEASASASV